MGSSSSSVSPKCLNFLLSSASAWIFLIWKKHLVWLCLTAPGKAKDMWILSPLALLNLKFQWWQEVLWSHSETTSLQAFILSRLCYGNSGAVKNNSELKVMSKPLPSIGSQADSHTSRWQCPLLAKARLAWLWLRGRLLWLGYGGWLSTWELHISGVSLVIVDHISGIHPPFLFKKEDPQLW